jgi:photosystem II stability/assembly factor-like uncharacterized protein
MSFLAAASGPRRAHAAAAWRRLVLGLVAATAWLLPMHAACAQGFHAVTSRDGIDVWAVGDSGTVYRSVSGGIQWTQQQLGDADLHGVAASGWQVLVVGDSGSVWRSTDSGGHFTRVTLSGSPDLRDLDMIDAARGWIVGAGGAVFATTDSGTTWSPQSSGTTAELLAVRFRDAFQGWAVGTGGTALHTIDGGGAWSPVALATSERLRDVDFSSSAVWIVGDHATCEVSGNGGGTFAAVDLGLDARSHLTGVWLESSTDILLTGGGGFLRHTTDGGATWSFQKNPVQDETSDLFFRDGGMRGWVTHRHTGAIVYTTDAGATWSYPGSNLRTWSLVQARESGAVRGNTFCLNRQNPNSIYAVMGAEMYKSLDRGDTWSHLGTISGGVTKTNAFYVSPTDSMKMVAAVDSSTTDRVVRSTDGGATWTTRLAIDFSEYGVPIEEHPDLRDVLLFAPEDGQVWISEDFGATWDVHADPGFRSPCDIQIVPGTETVWLGDGVTGSGQGQLFLSTDNAKTFTLVYSTTGSEIPMLAGSRLDPKLGLATAWSSGGVRRTTDTGGSWSIVSTATASWGCDIARDDPRVCIYGVFITSGAAGLSFDGGASGTWIPTNIPSVNYGMFAADRATIFALQATGIYKMRNAYTVTTNHPSTVTVTSPNGGEIWTAGELRSITWNAANLPLARIDYRRDSMTAWQTVATIEGYAGSFDWTVPADATVDAEVRVADAWDDSPEDASDAPFTILVPGTLTLTSPDGGEVWQYGTGHDITWLGSPSEPLRLEYRTAAAGPWNVVADSVPPAPPAYSWIIPNAPTTTARIRIGEAGGGLVDSSASDFSIVVPSYAVATDTVDFGDVFVNATASLNVSIGNPGTALLTIGSITDDGDDFAAVQPSLAVPAGGAEMLELRFSPAATGAQTAGFTLVADDPGSPHVLVARGTGQLVSDTGERPATFALWQDGPNPFHGSTSIRYRLPVRAHVALAVFDLQGRRVARLVDAEQDPGTYHVPFGPRLRTATGDRIGALAAGVYFARLEAGSFAKTYKLVLAR